VVSGDFDAIVVGVLKVLAGLAGALGLLWGYVAWDERQARRQFRSKEFEERVAGLFGIAIRGEEFQSVIRKVVSEAFTSQLDHVLGEVRDIAKRLTALERRVEGLAARVQRQRRSDGGEDSP
jgi:hypothetical protein